jgi:hypothetical protein
MDNSDLIDDYLSNRLTEAQQVVFEKEMAADSRLRARVEQQRVIIETIKKARAAELKAMLNKVPVPASPLISFTPMKMAAGIIGAAVITATVYFYVSKDKNLNPKEFSTSVKDSIQQEESHDSLAIDSAKAAIEQAAEIKQSDNKAKEEKPVSKTPVVKPSLDVVDPMKELTNEQSEEARVNRVAAIISSKIEVQVDKSERKYTHHYQFNQGKLILYGPFNQALYEVLEINGNKRSLFLYYQDHFYMLDEKQMDITPLMEIKDPALLSRLKEYRNP